MPDNTYKWHFTLVLILLFIGLWSQPLWLTPGKAGSFDWGTQMVRFESLRRTILQYHQWPGNNPWTLGGIPILGNPSVFIISVRGLLVLLFGTYWGLRFSILFYLFICFYGSWKLSGFWWQNRHIRLLFSLYVTANPAMIYHLSVGHILFLNFYLFPLLLYLLLSYKDDKWAGLKAGLVMAVAINESPAYMPQYATLILGSMFVWLCIKNYKHAAKQLLRWALLFVPVLLALSFYRIATVLELAHDYSRITGLTWHYDLDVLLEAYLVPHTRLSFICSGLAGGCWEVCCYFGIAAFIFWVRNLIRGLKWHHIMTILIIWAAAGNDSYFHIMYWIQKLPTFSSHLAFVRIRVFIFIFFGIAVINEFELLKSKILAQTNQKKWVILIAAVLIGEVFLVSHLIARHSHPEPIVNPSYTPEAKFQSVKKIEHSYIHKSWTAYEAMRMNLGWLDGFGASNLPPETICLDRDDSNYISEFHQGGVAVEPAYWSPNKILFKDLDPEKALTVNLNPGNPWYCNGVKAFPDYRIVELDKSFIVFPDSTGTVSLTYLYPGQKTGLIGTGLLFAFAVIPVCYFYFKKDNATSNG